jgi:hypothetical protein
MSCQEHKKWLFMFLKEIVFEQWDQNDEEISIYDCLF